MLFPKQTTLLLGGTGTGKSYSIYNSLFNILADNNNFDTVESKSGLILLSLLNSSYIYLFDDIDMDELKKISNRLDYKLDKKIDNYVKIFKSEVFDDFDYTSFGFGSVIVLTKQIGGTKNNPKKIFEILQKVKYLTQDKQITLLYSVQKRA